MKNYENVRQRYLEKIGDKKTAMIVRSNFQAKPIFEDKYYDYIKKEPFLFSIYEKWILSQSPFPFPNEDELYKLREIILQPLMTGKSDISNVHKKINLPALYLLLDILDGYFFKIFVCATEYYGIESFSDDQIELIATRALSICDEASNKKEGYPYFLNAFVDKTKCMLFCILNIGYKKFPEDTDDFINQIKNEWKELYPYSDSFQGFEVVPLIDPDDLIRFLKLPFENRQYQQLTKNKHYQQIMNYIVAISTFKPVPVEDIKYGYREKLIDLFVPLAETMFKKVKAKKSFSSEVISDGDLKKIITEAIQNCVLEFRYFYKTVEEGKKSSFKGTNFFAPIGFRKSLATIGNITDDNQFPFTSYIETKLTQKINDYFEDDKASSYQSLDQEFEDYEGSSSRMMDRISNDYTMSGDDIPDFDFIDENGQRVGWLIDTFANIVSKSVDTLRRWDREGLLKAQRGGFYKKYKATKTQYRYYIEKDRQEVPKIAELKLKNKRHQN